MEANVTNKKEDFVNQDLSNWIVKKWLKKIDRYNWLVKILPKHILSTTRKIVPPKLEKIRQQKMETQLHRW